MWSPGTPILYREITRGHIWTARPVTVAHDAPDLIALCLHRGTCWRRCTPSEPGGDLVACKAGLQPWHLAAVEWAFSNTLIVCTPGAAHATHLMWGDHGEFSGWYVNLQEPLRRTALGYDFLDQELDLVVAPDRAWRWKDADHLEHARDIGLFSAEQVAAIRAEGERVIARIEAAAPPFDDAWLNWRAPADWPVPVLPPGWDVPPVTSQ